MRRFLVLIVLVSNALAARVAWGEASPQALARAEERLAARFVEADVDYPPRQLALVALKAEARLELWADGGAGWRFVRSYLVRAASGKLGPKLRQGDHQVPEGVYRVAALNPASRYHLALRLDYPNAFDQARARADGRGPLGGDIMIHGDRVSDGCLPVGDAGVEEIFAVVSRVGVENVSVIVSPVDLRRVDAKTALGKVRDRPAWLGELYASLQAALGKFNLTARPGGEPLVPARGLRLVEPKCKALDAADCVRRCDAGDTASCARAGMLYAGGRGVAVDLARAWPLLRKACSGGDASGCGALGELVLSDEGQGRDASRAADLARAACDGGDGHGCQALAKLCNDRLLYPAEGLECGREQVEQLRYRAVATLRSDCQGWGAYDCRTLASIYASGDAATAERFATGSCSGGDPGGCDELGQLLEQGGEGTRARALYDRACARGYLPSCERLAAAREGTVTASR